MAKLIYEDDHGHQTSFEISPEAFGDLESLFGINAWDEIFKAFKTVIDESQIKEIE